jgi:hypothetical protein
MDYIHQTQKYKYFRKGKEHGKWNNKRGRKVERVFHKTRITQSMRFNVVIKLKPTLKDKEDWYKKIYTG